MSGVQPRWMRAHFPVVPVSTGDPPSVPKGGSCGGAHSVGTISAAVPQIHTPYRAPAENEQHGKPATNGAEGVWMALCRTTS